MPVEMHLHNHTSHQKYGGPKLVILSIVLTTACWLDINFFKSIINYHLNKNIVFRISIRCSLIYLLPFLCYEALLLSFSEKFERNRVNLIADINRPQW